MVVSTLCITLGVQFLVFCGEKILRVVTCLCHRVVIVRMGLKRTFGVWVYWLSFAIKERGLGGHDDYPNGASSPRGGVD